MTGLESTYKELKQSWAIITHDKDVLRLESTYKELKRKSNKLYREHMQSLESTYKELKLDIIKDVLNIDRSLESTYKELKLPPRNFKKAKKKRFRVYL